MKNLVKILQVAVKKHGETTPLTLGYLLNLARMAEGQKEVAAIREEKEHAELLEWVSPFGQD